MPTAGGQGTPPIAVENTAAEGGPPAHTAGEGGLQQDTVGEGGPQADTAGGELRLDLAAMLRMPVPRAREALLAAAATGVADDTLARASALVTAAEEAQRQSAISQAIAAAKAAQIARTPRASLRLGSRATATAAGANGLPGVCSSPSKLAHPGVQAGPVSIGEKQAGSACVGEGQAGPVSMGKTQARLAGAGHEQAVPASAGEQHMTCSRDGRDVPACVREGQSVPVSTGLPAASTDDVGASRVPEAVVVEEGHAVRATVGQGQSAASTEAAGAAARVPVATACERTDASQRPAGFPVSVGMPIAPSAGPSGGQAPASGLSYGDDNAPASVIRAAPMAPAEGLSGDQPQARSGGDGNVPAASSGIGSAADGRGRVVGVSGAGGSGTGATAGAGGAGGAAGCGGADGGRGRAAPTGSACWWRMPGTSRSAPPAKPNATSHATLPPAAEARTSAPSRPSAISGSTATAGGAPQTAASKWNLD